MVFGPLQRVAEWFAKEVRLRVPCLIISVLAAALLCTPWLLSLHDADHCEDCDASCPLCILTTAARLAPFSLHDPVLETALWVRGAVPAIRVPDACFVRGHPPRGPPSDVIS